MVKITYQPWNEVVIHQAVKHEPNELFELVIRHALTAGVVGVPPVVTWAEGVVFLISPFSESEKEAEDKIKGILHLAEVNFALVPEYRSKVQINIEGNQQAVRLQRVDNNPILADVARFLKTIK